LTRVRHGLVFALIALALAACGGSDDEPPAAGTSESSAATAPATTAPETETIDPAAQELAAVAEAWYARADPAVCERMTNRLLAFGWEKSGKAGVKACKRKLEKAEPAEDVEIVEAEIDGDKAEVTVAYVRKGNEAKDRIHFLRRGGEWRMDEVGVVVEETA
jgi:predicted lipid-binding transport protein (Tim44 family)